MMKNIINKEQKYMIDVFCDEFRICDYTINSDGSVDVRGDVDIENYEKDELPFEFNVIGGDFRITHSGINSNYGFPRKVLGSFYCTVSSITTCVGLPQDVGGDYYIDGNENLVSLVSLPEVVNGDFSCTDVFMTSLNGLPKYVGGDCTFSGMDLENLEGLPKKIGGELVMNGNVIKSLYVSYPVDMGGYECVFTDFEGNAKNTLVLFNGDVDDANQKVPTVIVYFKYQTYYDVFVDGIFNMENFKLLIDDIKEGLL